MINYPIALPNLRELRMKQEASRLAVKRLVDRAHSAVYDEVPHLGHVEHGMAVADKLRDMDFVRSAAKD